MKHPVEPISLKNLKSYPLSDRKSKVSTQDFGQPWQKGGHFMDFLNRLPNLLGATDLCSVIRGILTAHQNQKPVAIGMGAHVIKVGLNPILIDLMKRGIITSIAMNGACTIHDLEIALTGKTSEDVAASIGDGAFGMAKETSDLLNAAIAQAQDQKIGLGLSVGRLINAHNMPHAEKSLLATGARLDIPITVHIALGTDIIHMHPGFDPGAAGEASHLDFRLFAAIVAKLEEGVFMNIGSAVIIPEVFLKAITLVRNLGHHPEHFMSVNMDFIRHYRPLTNVVNRPTAKGGQGINLVGHHEVLVPIIAAGVIEGLALD